MKTRVITLIGGMVAAGALLYQIPSQSIDQKISPHIPNSLKSRATVNVIVGMKEKADLAGAVQISSKEEKGAFVYKQLTEIASTSQADLQAWLKNQNISFQSIYIGNMIALEGVTLEQIQEIAKRSDVEKIFNNPSVQQKLPRGSASEKVVRAVGANLTAIGAPKVWSEYKTQGEGIVVAGQDTGVDWTHKGLIKAYRGNNNGTYDHKYSWHDSIKKAIGGGNNKCGYNIDTPCDDDQHGTHTMGTMIGNDGTNTVGVAPGAKWMACRNMDAGVGRPTTYIECFEYFLAPYPQGGNPMKDGDPKAAPHVINNSWGCPESELCDGTEFKDVLAAMKAAGIMVVASAGNEGPNCDTIGDPPATYTMTTLSVGAMDHRNGTIASFSSRGPSVLDKGVGPDVSAPGVSITSTIPGGTYSGSMWSGTSMAGPHVVGQVALMWSANPKLIGKIDETIAIIQKTATPKTTTQKCGGIGGDKIPNNTYGYGNIDVYKSVTEALKF